MADIQNDNDIQLQAATPRVEAMPLPDNVVVPPAQIGPGTLPDDVEVVPGTNFTYIPVGILTGAIQADQVSADIVTTFNLFAQQISAEQLTLGDGTVGGDLRSQAFVPGSDGWRIRPDGSAEFNNVALRGAIMGGAFTEYAWPTSGTGFYLGASGLMIGSYNAGRWFHADVSGYVSMPGLTVIDGVLTISQLNVIGRSNIVPDSVTVGGGITFASSWAGEAGGSLGDLHGVDMTGGGASLIVAKVGIRAADATGSTLKPVVLNVRLLVGATVVQSWRMRRFGDNYSDDSGGSSVTRYNHDGYEFTGTVRGMSGIYSIQVEKPPSPGGSLDWFENIEITYIALFR